MGVPVLISLLSRTFYERPGMPGDDFKKKLQALAAIIP
jgi:hypothetical protein